MLANMLGTSFLKRLIDSSTGTAIRVRVKRCGVKMKSSMTCHNRVQVIFVLGFLYSYSVVQEQILIRLYSTFNSSDRVDTHAFQDKLVNNLKHVPNLMFQHLNLREEVSGQ